MKVTITGYHLGDSLARNLYVTFQKLGHQVAFVEDLTWVHHDNRLGRVFRSSLLRYPRVEIYRSQRVVRRVIAQHPDLFISLWSWLRPEAVQEIRNAGIRTVLWYPDAIVNLDRQYVLVAPFDLLLFKDPYAVRLFREKLSLPVFYLPEACNPLWHRPVSLTEQEYQRYRCDITTAGSMYPYRTRLLEIFNGYDLKLWGGAWPSGWGEPAQ